MPLSLQYLAFSHSFSHAICLPIAAILDCSLVWLGLFHDHVIAILQHHCLSYHMIANLCQPHTWLHAISYPVSVQKGAMHSYTKTVATFASWLLELPAQP